MSNKLPRQFSDTDLLKLLDDSTVKEKSIADDTTTPSPVKFLSLFNVVPGKNKVKTKALHSLYREWAGKSSLTLIQFTTQVRNYLPYVKDTSTFSIQETALNLSARFAKEILKLNQPKRAKNKRIKEHIDKYIKQFDLKRGDVFVDSDQAHSDYWMWAAKTGKKKRLSLAQFLDIMRLYCNILINQHGKTMIGFQKYDRIKK